jgi:hypothetical protein
MADWVKTAVFAGFFRAAAVKPADLGDAATRLPHLTESSRNRRLSASIASKNCHRADAMSIERGYRLELLR